MRLSTPPRLSARVKSRQRSRNRLARSTFAFEDEREHSAEGVHLLFGERVLGMRGEAGVEDFEDAGAFLEPAAIFGGLWEWRSIRSARVLRPRSRELSKGEAMARWNLEEGETGGEFFVVTDDGDCRRSCRNGR